MKDFQGESAVLLLKFHKLSSLWSSGALYPERALAAARYSFSQNNSLHLWDANCESIVNEKINGEFSLEALNWFEECAEAIGIFALYVYGYYLERFLTGKIDKQALLNFEVLLPAFLFERNQEICDAYSLRFLAGNRLCPSPGN
jgi:hypothetical protein